MSNIETPKKRKNIVLSVIKTPSNKVLIAERLEHEKAQDNQTLSWVFPGGGFKEGVDPKRALVRDVKAETGLDIKVNKLISKRTYETPYVQLYYYSCRIIPGKIKPVQSVNSIARIKWVTAKDLENFFTTDLDPGVASFLKL